MITHLVNTYYNNCNEYWNCNNNCDNCNKIVNKLLIYIKILFTILLKLLKLLSWKKGLKIFGEFARKPEQLSFS